MKNLSKLTILAASLFSLASCNAKKETTYDGYQCQVLYRDNSPVTGVSVKYCTEQTCYRPIAVDSNGIAKATTLADNTYYVHVENIPTGYAYNPNAHISTEKDKQIVIYLDTLTTLSQSGDYLELVENTLFNVSIEEEQVSKLTFTSETGGSYSLESWADYYAATENIDPLITMYKDGAVVGSDNDSGVGDNFKYDFTLEANETVTFEISVSADFYPSEFTVEFKKA